MTDNVNEINVLMSKIVNPDYVERIKYSQLLTHDSIYDFLDGYTDFKKNTPYKVLLFTELNRLSQQ